ncbi:MAG: 50S ribosomal protein L32 [Berkelbacteria bacterium GW2011_GWB1_38_5]|uniref:Large ribosomal subunit protein bL32 n=2 Tax=Candidatus Berkelbacteria TaxID=1618330 RepID=A0A0G0NYI8_9BACT|nr:MAG: 50S ribosomal protein L32 [Berkelbacteria bacterium GW2011_GWB1_38_5]KKQ90934.1 MAG: 50S ribosomal protein L32 [Berkelbacteria bacterium GW2011_GWA1_39_10]
MAEPKKRLTSSRSGNRRSHLQLKKQTLSNCPKCKNANLPHLVCPTCGFYNGNDVLRLEEKAKAKDQRRKEQEKELEK